MFVKNLPTSARNTSTASLRSNGLQRTRLESSSLNSQQPVIESHGTRHCTSSDDCVSNQHSICRQTHSSAKKRARRMNTKQTLKEACSHANESATCVQRFDDSRNSAIRITYRISLRSSSLREPRYPSLRVVRVYILA